MSTLLAAGLMIWMLVFAWRAARWAFSDIDRLFEELAKGRWQDRWLQAADEQGKICFARAMFLLGHGSYVARCDWPPGWWLAPRMHQDGRCVFRFQVGSRVSFGMVAMRGDDCNVDWYEVTGEMTLLTPR